MALIFFFIKCFFIILFLMIMIFIIFQGYNCIEEKENFDTIYWKCSKFDKCKVVKRPLDLLIILRFVYYFVFYIIFYIYMGIFLYTFRRINLFGKAWVIIIYKIFDYVFLLALIILEYIYDSKYYNFVFDNNLFICEKIIYYIWSLHF